jgi:peroxiredoxin
MKCIRFVFPRIPALAFVCVLVSGPASLSRSERATAADQSPASKLGQKIDNLIFKDAAGKPMTLYDFKDKKAIVVVFLSFECPISTSYSPVLADMAKTFAERGVAFLGICSQEDEDAAQIARHARDFQLPFPVVKDENYRASKTLKATTTPEAFLLDRRFVLCYRGQIDNAYAARLKKNARITRHDLREALEELLAGKAISEPSSQPIGCTIRLPLGNPRTVDLSRSERATYYQDVAPILQNHCQQCHRPGEVAPFSLMTYKQAVNWAEDIKEYTQNRQMPPWKPVEGGPFHGERKMTDKEIATLAAWVDGGTPRGNPKDAPPPQQFRDVWQLGQPDLILTMPEEFQVGSAGIDFYRYFVLPTDLAEDKYISAVEVRPGNRRVVHHAILFADGSGKARRLEQQERQRKKDPGEEDRGPGFSMPMFLGFLPGFLPQGALGGWAPGLVPRHLPDGTGYFLPKGADVIVQLHYNRSGRVEKDSTAVGLYFAKKSANKRLQGIAVPAQFIAIPSGVDQYRVEGSITLRQDGYLHSIMPHMHLIGREIKVMMIPPEGPARTLVAINDWDFNWQEIYSFQETIPIKAGTRFLVEGVYNNSATNSKNPNQPPKPIFAGEATANEMCVGFLGVTSDKPGHIRYDIQVRIPGWRGLPSLGLPAFGL